MIPQASHGTSFNGLDPDKALHSRKPSAETPKVFGHLSQFCSVRQCIAIFYISVAIILFIGFVLSKDAFDKHHTVFDSVAIIQSQPPTSSANRSETPPSSSTPPPQERQEWDEGTPLANGIIIRHPFVSPNEEPLPPQAPSSAPQTSPTPPITKEQSSPTPPESPVPGPSAIQLHTGFAPSWATSTPSKRFDPSSLDLPESSEGKTKDNAKKP